MRNHTFVVLTAALALAGAVDLADARDRNQQRKPRPEVKALLEAKTFSDAGEYSGVLSGSIAINGTEYRVAPDVAIYEVGRGIAPTGHSVSGRMVAVNGIVLDGAKIVYQIIVRSPGAIGTREAIREVALGTGPK